jgi:hypothetical protein
MVPIYQTQGRHIPEHYSLYTCTDITVMCILRTCQKMSRQNYTRKHSQACTGHPQLKEVK